MRRVSDRAACFMHARVRHVYVQAWPRVTAAPFSDGAQFGAVKR